MFTLKKISKGFEKAMTSVAFAEEGEHETAVHMLKEENSGNAQEKSKCVTCGRELTVGASTR